MSWKKYFVDVPNAQKLEKWLETQGAGGIADASGFKSNFQTWLPEVYAGPPNRIERYKQYEQMDKGSTEISQAMDTIAEFCTQKEEKSKRYFTLEFNDESTEPEVEVLQQKLHSWTKLNKFDKRLKKIVRNAIMYGDEFFIRDPETYKWLWVDRANVEKVIVNEAEGKKPEEYWIQNPDLNLQTLSISPSQKPGPNQGYPSGLPGTPKGPGPSPVHTTNQSQSSGIQSLAVDATHVVHLSINEGLDNNWPFGVSILENVYKAYKQIALLEDAILIYRVHRAPERRVFYIDVGQMPPHRVMSHLERIKNEINQRRIPTRTGGGENILDSTYNPMSMTEDYFFPQHADGRGSRVETLPGGENLGQINDLNYFKSNLKQGLNIPDAYVRSGSNEDASIYNDGRATTALIAELRFAEFCKHIQSLLNEMFDKEFKLYLKAEGINISAEAFELVLNEPQNFAKYRQIELDNSMISTWSSVAEVPYISKRFGMKRWLGLSEDEIVENERMWKEENKSKVEDLGAGPEVEVTDDLRSLGIRPELGGAGLPEMGPEDFGPTDEVLPGEESPIGGPGTSAEAGAAGSLPGAPPPPPPPGG